MKASSLGFAAAEMRQARRLLCVGTVLLTILGLVRAETVEGFVAYTMITAAALLPSALWLRARAPGIPILPAVAGFHYLYFAIPILRQNLGGASYTAGETLRAAATVALFLGLAGVAWALVLGRSFRLSAIPDLGFSSGTRGRLLMFGGIAAGVLFQIAIMSGWLDGIGTLFGVVRAIALTAASIACYLLGNFRACGRLSGQAWGLALAGIAFLVCLSWSSLYLVGGMQFVLAAALGYVITAKRIPWAALAPVLVVLFVLHAGKGEMRDRYWTGGYSQDVSVGQVPGLFADWLTNGIDNIAAGDVQQDVIDRASLLYLLLRVQQLTPDYIPYLGGETYALLPTYLVPRFLNPDKTFSQAGLALLNIRYGLQTREGVATTTIGWGVISEAFANFGYIGVTGAALVFGALSALFTRWSAGAAPLSLPTLLSVAALISMTNIEADFGFLLTNLWQALVATLLFFLPIKYLSGSEIRQPITQAAR